MATAAISTGPMKGVKEKYFVLEEVDERGPALRTPVGSENEPPQTILISSRQMPEVPFQRLFDAFITLFRIGWLCVN